jgi:hypothetical protein
LGFTALGNIVQTQCIILILKHQSLSSLLFCPFFFLWQQHRIHALSSSFSFTADGAASPSRPLLSQFSIFVRLSLSLPLVQLSLSVSHVYQEPRRKGKRDERIKDMGNNGFNFWVLLIFCSW